MASDIHGLRATRPWLLSDPKFPAPHLIMLQDHFSTAIYENMKAAAYCRDDDNDDSDDSDSDLDEVSFASG